MPATTVSVLTRHTGTLVVRLLVDGHIPGVNRVLHDRHVAVLRHALHQNVHATAFGRRLVLNAVHQESVAGLAVIHVGIVLISTTLINTITPKKKMFTLRLSTTMGKIVCQFTPIHYTISIQNAITPKARYVTLIWSLI